MKVIKTILKIFLFCFIVISCEKKEQFTHTIHIDGNVPGALYMTYTSSGSYGSTAFEGDVTLSYINTDPELFLDSITGKQTGYTKWKVINQTIREYKSYTVTLEEIKR